MLVYMEAESTIKSNPEEAMSKVKICGVAIASYLV